MDEADYASERERLIVDTALEDHKNNINRDADRRQKMELLGIANKCKYCDTVLETYDRSFCEDERDDSGKVEWSCSEEYRKEREAEKRNGRG